MLHETLTDVFTTASVTWFDVGALLWLALFPYLNRRRRIGWMAVVMLVPILGAVGWYTYAIHTHLRVRAMLHGITTAGTPPG
jgi:hypothetical protein